MRLIGLAVGLALSLLGRRGAGDEQDAEYHFTTGYPGRLSPAADEVYQQFVMVDALAQFATDKMDLEQTVKWAEDTIKAIYAKFV